MKLKHASFLVPNKRAFTTDKNASLRALIKSYRKHDKYVSLNEDSFGKKKTSSLGIDNRKRKSLYPYRFVQAKRAMMRVNHCYSYSDTDTDSEGDDGTVDMESIQRTAYFSAPAPFHTIKRAVSERHQCDFV